MAVLHWLYCTITRALEYRAMYKPCHISHVQTARESHDLNMDFCGFQQLCIIPTQEYMLISLVENTTLKLFSKGTNTKTWSTILFDNLFDK